MEYFHQRPRASQVIYFIFNEFLTNLYFKLHCPYRFQIGAAASPQSQPIPSRDHLDKIENELKDKLGPDGVVPLPNW